VSRLLSGGMKYGHRTMTAAQRRKHKQSNRERRILENLFRRMPKRESNNGVRRRFEQAHDE
jgi:hypothetical protein